MRFNFDAYEKLYPRQEKVPEVPVPVEEDDSMLNPDEPKEEKKKEYERLVIEEMLENGNTGTGESDTE